MTLNVDRLLHEEVRRVEALYRRWLAEIDAEKGSLPKVKHYSVPNFVESVFEVHRPQVEEWGSWRLHGPVELADLRGSDLERVLDLWNTLFAEFSRANPAWRSSLQYSTVGMGIVRYRASHSFEDWCNATPYPDVYIETALLAAERTVSTRFRRDGYKLALAVYVGCAEQVFRIPVRVGQKLSAAVLACLADDVLEKKLPASMREHAKTSRRLFETFFSRLGDTQKETPFATTLSVAPSSFLRLGEYGEKSCYRNGGEWELSKHHIALMPHSVVGLFYRDQDAAKLRVTASGRRLGAAAGRCWGLFSKNGLYAGNFYLISADMARPALQSLAKQFCQGEHSKVAGNSVVGTVRSVHGGIFYVNADAEAVHATPAFKQEVEEALRFLVTYVAPVRGKFSDPCCVPRLQKAMLAQLEKLRAPKVAQPEEDNVKEWTYFTGLDGRQWRRVANNAEWERVYV